MGLLIVNMIPSPKDKYCIFQDIVVVRRRWAFFLQESFKISVFLSLTDSPILPDR